MILKCFPNENKRGRCAIMSTVNYFVRAEKVDYNGL